MECNVTSKYLTRFSHSNRILTCLSKKNRLQNVCGKNIKFYYSFSSTDSLTNIHWENHCLIDFPSRFSDFPKVKKKTIEKARNNRGKRIGMIIEPVHNKGKLFSPSNPPFSYNDCPTNIRFPILSNLIPTNILVWKSNIITFPYLSDLSSIRWILFSKIWGGIIFYTWFWN